MGGARSIIWLPDYYLTIFCYMGNFPYNPFFLIHMRQWSYQIFTELKATINAIQGGCLMAQLTEGLLSDQFLTILKIFHRAFSFKTKCNNKPLWSSQGLWPQLFPCLRGVLRVSNGYHTMMWPILIHDKNVHYYASNDFCMHQYISIAGFMFQ